MRSYFLRYILAIIEGLCREGVGWSSRANAYLGVNVKCDRILSETCRGHITVRETIVNHCGHRGGTVKYLWRLVTDDMGDMN